MPKIIKQGNADSYASCPYCDKMYHAAKRSLDKIIALHLKISHSKDSKPIVENVKIPVSNLLAANKSHTVSKYHKDVILKSIL